MKAKGIAGSYVPKFGDEKSNTNKKSKIKRQAVVYFVGDRFLLNGVKEKWKKLKEKKFIMLT